MVKHREYPILMVISAEVMTETYLRQGFF